MRVSISAAAANHSTLRGSRVYAAFQAFSREKAHHLKICMLVKRSKADTQTDFLAVVLRARRQSCDCCVWSRFTRRGACPAAPSPTARGSGTGRAPEAPCPAKPTHLNVPTTDTGYATGQDVGIVHSTVSNLACTRTCTRFDFVGTWFFLRNEILFVHRSEIDL